MSTSFNSILVSLGLDTTGARRELAAFSNQASQGIGKLQQMLRAGGLLGAARFLGIGAAIYGLKEGFDLAIERAQELEAAQEKNREAAVQLAEELQGTGGFETAYEHAVDYTDQLDAATKQTLALVDATKNAKDAVGDLFVGVVGNFSEKFRKNIEYLDFLVGVAPKKLGGGGMTAQQSAVAAFQSYNYDTNKSQNDAANAAQGELHKWGIQNLFAKLGGGAGGNADPMEKIRQEMANDAEKIKPLMQQQADYRKKIFDLADQLDKNASIAQTPRGKAIRDKIYAEAEDARTKLLAVDEKINAAQAAYNNALEKSRDLDENLLDTKKKQLSIQAQLDQNEQDLAQVRFHIDFPLLLSQEKINDLKERENSLTERGIELAQQKKDLVKEQADLQKQLGETIAKHNEAVDAQLAPSEADIRSGKRGNATEQSRLEQADRMMAEAERYYDYANAEAMSGDEAQDPNQRNQDYQKAAADKKHAEDLAKQADALKAGLHTKESLERALTAQDYADGVKILQTELQNINKNLTPAKKAVK